MGYDHATSTVRARTDVCFCFGDCLLEVMREGHTANSKDLIPSLPIHSECVQKSTVCQGFISDGVEMLR